jgi:hypothetical protein
MTFIILLMYGPKTWQNMACRLELTYEIVLGTEKAYGD